MGRKATFIPSLIITFITLILLLLVTISTPLAGNNSSVFYISEATHTNLRDVTGNGPNPQRNVTGIRAGIWGYCSRGEGDSSYAYCTENHHNWNATFATPATDTNSAAYSQRSIGYSWTRGLVVAVVAFVFTFIGLVLSVFPHLIVQLIAALWLLLTLLMTLVAFAIQIAFFVYFKHRIHQLDSSASVMPGPGFYLTLVSLPLLLFSSVTVCCGWRREKNGGASSSGSYEYGGGSSGLLAKARRPFGRKNKGAAAGYGERDATNGSTTGAAEEDNKNSIPLSSRQRVMDAFNRS